MPEIFMDSTGIRDVGGKKFIVHEVEAGETLYALSRRYNVHVQLIQEANQEDVSVLNVGQNVLIPIPNVSKDAEDFVHIVRSSETLFSISRTYNVSVDQLRSWNNLADNSISIGQKLIIREQEKAEEIAPEAGQNTHTVGQSETMYSISRMYDTSTDELMRLNGLSSTALNVGQVLVLPQDAGEAEKSDNLNSSMLPANVEKADPSSVPGEKEAVAETVVSVENDPEIAAESTPVEKPLEKIVQKGMAEVNEQRSETKKYLGLHRDAPIGTIMQVRNEMNNQSVFVRIVGTIPDTGDNGKVILKISQKAYDRLGAVDSRFPVEISYMP